MDNKTDVQINNIVTNSDNKLFRKINWKILPIIWFCFILNYLDKSNISFAQLEMKQHLGFNDVVFGLAASALYIGLILFEVPSNIILSKVGIRKTILRVMILWGSCTVAMCFVTTPELFYILRFLTGVFEAGFAPGILYYLSLWYPDNRRAQAVAIFYTATSVARIIAGPLAASLMTGLDGLWGLRGWQWLFIGEGLPCLLFAVLAYYILSDSPDQAKWLTNQEKQRVQELVNKDGKVEHHFEKRHLIELISDVRIWICGLIGFLILQATLGLTFWQPALLKTLGLTIKEIGWYSSIPALCGVIASIIIARHSDATGERCWHFVITAFIGALGLFLANISIHSIWLTLACLTITWIGIASAYALTWAMPGQVLVGKHAATGYAILTVMQGCAGIIGPIVIAYLKTSSGNYSSSLYFMGGSCVMAAILCIVFYRMRTVSSRKQLS